MDKNFRDNPEEFWRESLSKYRKIVGKPEEIDPVADLDQIDREGTIMRSIACMSQVAEHTAAAISPVCKTRIWSTHKS
jgi:hypothetical protein